MSDALLQDFYQATLDLLYEFQFVILCTLLGFIAIAIFLVLSGVLARLFLWVFCCCRKYVKVDKPHDPAQYLPVPLEPEKSGELVEIV